MAYLKLNRPEEALKDAVMARTIDPAYVKAWYREGSAYAALAPPQWEEAALAFFHASEMDPGNADVKAAFQHAITEGRKEHATR
ncbi:hypothetical protein FOA52_009229 [Chlamydomonas sp. UWO 241]|nr:hypothetical protein FOA52_009229 [Chlamydomonas sp. UWO 241]